VLFTDSQIEEIGILKFALELEFEIYPSTWLRVVSLVETI
jgi:hypothetical protein